MIGVFDSGYGGLSVLKPMIDLMPEYDYLYLGDNARAPYGGHSNDNILKFSEQAVKYLFANGATIIIFACNTASAVALRYLQNKYLEGENEKNRKILGVLIPTVEASVAASKNNKIAVVGTRATIKSKVYEMEICKIDSEKKVYSQECPLLVPFIEEDWHKKPEARIVLKKYLKSMKNVNVDTLILACTHYPLMKKEFSRIMGKKVKLIESGITSAYSLKKYLQKHLEIELKLSKTSSRMFLTTDDPISFQNFVEKHFGMKIKTPTKISLD